MEQQLTDKIAIAIDRLRFRLHQGASLVTNVVIALPFDIFTSTVYAIGEGIASFRAAMTATGYDVANEWNKFKRGF